MVNHFSENRIISLRLLKLINNLSFHFGELLMWSGSNSSFCYSGPLFCLFINDLKQWSQWCGCSSCPVLIQSNVKTTLMYHLWLLHVVQLFANIMGYREWITGQNFHMPHYAYRCISCKFKKVVIKSKMSLLFLDRVNPFAFYQE